MAASGRTEAAGDGPASAQLPATAETAARLLSLDGMPPAAAQAAGDRPDGLGPTLGGTPPRSDGNSSDGLAPAEGSPGAVQGTTDHPADPRALAEPEAPLTPSKAAPRAALALPGLNPGEDGPCAAATPESLEPSTPRAPSELPPHSLDGKRGLGSTTEAGEEAQAVGAWGERKQSGVEQLSIDIRNCRALGPCLHPRRPMGGAAAGKEAAFRSLLSKEAAGCAAVRFLTLLGLQCSKGLRVFGPINALRTLEACVNRETTLR